MPGLTANTATLGCSTGSETTPVEPQQAQQALTGNKKAAPACPGVGAPGGSRCPSLARDQETTMVDPQPADDLPPASVPQRLDDAGNWIALVRADLNTVIRDLPGDTPMWVVVDIVNALWNLRNAAALLDKATATLEADAQAVLW